MRSLIFIAGIFLLGEGLRAQTTQEDKPYRTIKIGDQIWMAENLNVSTYRNGDSIPQVQDPKAWSALKAGAWCYYENKTESGASYGKLYNWYAIHDPRGLAPEGWHIASDAEWTKLTEFLGGKIGSSLKIKSAKGWAGGGNGTNETGFAALPGGARGINESFSFAGNYGYWWTSTEYNSFSAWNRFLGSNNGDIGRSTGWKEFGNAVRCVKDDNEIPLYSGAVATDSISSKEKYDMATITIGSQIWTLQNLSITTFQNGDAVPEAKTELEWNKAGELKQPAWCYYNNDSSNDKKYGKLYNWYAVNDKRGLAPRSWHIPAGNEWATLIKELGGETTAGAKMKASETGSTGLLCGFRDSDGKFYNDGFAGYWWSATESLPTSAWCYSITYISDALNSNNSGDKQKGFSVRCIRD